MTETNGVISADQLKQLLAEANAQLRSSILREFESRRPASAPAPPRYPSSVVVQPKNPKPKPTPTAAKKRKPLADRIWEFGVKAFYAGTALFIVFAVLGGYVLGITYGVVCYLDTPGCPD